MDTKMAETTVEAKTRKTRKPAEVMILKLVNANELTWSDEDEEVFASTHDAEVALRKTAKAGETYRIVTVHREVTASIEQREPKVKLA